MIPKTFDENKHDLLVPGNFKDIVEPLKAAAGQSLGRTLDIGSNTTWFARFVDDYYGIDTDSKIVERTRAYWVKQKRWSEAEALSRVVVSTSDRLPYADGFFDTVFMRDVLEHVDNAPGFYAEAVRVLKTGGLLYVSCPDSQRHVWKEPTHKRPFPIAAQIYLSSVNGMTPVYRGYESVLAGTQRVAGVLGARTPWLIRIFWSLWFWPRNAVTICRKG